MAMCVMAVVAAAPCQCFSPGGIQITSPGRISSIGPPQRCARPAPAVTIRVWPSAWVCQAVRAPGSNVTLAPSTRAGEQLIARLRPALGDIRGAVDLITGLRDRPAGRVRLVVSPIAATTVLAPKLGQFARAYPDVVLDVTTDESRVDLVAAGFDAGIHFGEFIERDMITFRVSKDHRPAIVGSPRYFESHEQPVHPRDLTKHRCINFRHGSAGVYRWEFDKGKQSLTVAVNGPLIVDDVEIMVRAALDGVGLAFMAEEHAAPHLASGALVRVLEDWCPPFPGFFLYYPRQRQLSAALAALIETLRL